MAGHKVELVLDARAELGECPIWSVEEQCLYWIDIHGKSFNRFDPVTGKNRMWALPDMPGSFVLREGGGVVIAMRDGFHSFDTGSGALGKLADAPYDPAQLRFNDGRTDRQGRFWAGAMLVDFMNGDKSVERAFYSFDGSEVRQRIAPIDQANGTVFSLDGRTMYRAETLQKTILAYDLDPASGEVSNERVFADVPPELGMPDGATIDSEGAYWAALPAGPEGGSVARFTADGKLDQVIEIPVLVPTMPAFGGPDMSTLYVTSGRLEPMLGLEVSETSGGIFAIETKFRGVPETKFRQR